MWQQYKKTFIPVQVLIALICAAGFFVWKMPAIALIFAIVLPMEGAAFIGAAWSYRLKRKIEVYHENKPARPLF